jgi:hypothetical protein
MALCVLALGMAVGCASTEVTKRDSKIGTEKIPRPDRIYVYPFAATPADIPSWSVAAGRYAQPSETPNPEEIEVGRMIGDLVAKELVTEIAEMGLAAYKRSKHSLPRPNELMITGYFEAVEVGSTVKRLALGFGSGATAKRGRASLGRASSNPPEAKPRVWLSRLPFWPPPLTRSA